MLHGNEVKTVGEIIPDLGFQMWPCIALKVSVSYISSTFIK